jgi:hypothetical protein
MLAGGCGSERSRTSDPRGAIAISAALSDADVSIVEVTVTGTGIATPMTANLTRSGGEWTAALTDVPAGSDRTVQANARDAGGTLIYQGSATGVAVTPGATAAVVIVMQQVAPPPPFSDTAPVIDSVVASDLTPLAGDTISLDVTAHDDDAASVLSYQWTATGGTFTPSAANAAHVQWTVPSPNAAATYTISVTATDEKGLAASVSFDIGVPLTPGSLQLNVTVNSWPAVSAMTATPTSVATGSAVALSATATDSDGDSVTVTWTADCAGSFSSATGASTTFTPSAPPVGNRCTVTATAADAKGGSATGSVGVWVGLGAAPVSQACVWEQVASHDLTSAPAGSIPAGGLAGGQGVSTVGGRTAYTSTSDWMDLLIPTGLSASDDVFAVEVDVFRAASSTSSRLTGFLLFGTHAADSTVPFWLNNYGELQGLWAGWHESTSGTTTVEWRTPPSPVPSNGWLATAGVVAGTAITGIQTGAWHRLRVEGARSSCRFRLLVDGALLSTWTGTCDVSGANLGLYSDGAGTPVGVAWSDMVIYRGSDERCIP